MHLGGFRTFAALGSLEFDLPGTSARPFSREEPYSIPEADAWSPLGWLRLGRALKFIEAAHWSGAAPVALDEPNQCVCLALGTRALSFGSPGQLATSAIAIDAVDPELLDAALLDCTWNEVLRLRREVLPAVSALRTVLLRAARRTAGAAPRSLDIYHGLLNKLRGDLDSAQAEHARKWQELRIGGLLKAAGASAITGVGLEAVVSPSSWSGVLQLLLASIAAAGASLASELKPLLSTHARVHGHPLYFFDKLPKSLMR